MESIAALLYINNSPSLVRIIIVTRTYLGLPLEPVYTFYDVLMGWYGIYDRTMVAGPEAGPALAYLGPPCLNIKRD